jgi:hypothetical protein
MVILRIVVDNAELVIVIMGDENIVVGIAVQATVFTIKINIHAIYVFQIDLKDQENQNPDHSAHAKKLKSPPTVVQTELPNENSKVIVMINAYVNQPRKK